MSRIDFSRLTPQEWQDLAGDLLDSVGEADMALHQDCASNTGGILSRIFVADSRFPIF